MVTKRLAYGLLEPTENLETVEDQMSKAHKYYNKLVEIENSIRPLRRESYNNGVKRLSPEYEGLEQQLLALQASKDTIENEIKQQRVLNRSKKLDSSNHKQTLAGIKLQIKLVYEKQKEERAKFKEKLKRPSKEKVEPEPHKRPSKEKVEPEPHKRPSKEKVEPEPQWLAEQEEIDEKRNKLISEARKASGLYWGTYLSTEDAFKNACKATPPHKNLHFQRWTGEGKIRVCRNSEPTVSNSLFFIDPLPGDSWEKKKDKGVPSPRGEGKRSRMKTQLHLLVNSNRQKKIAPVWATFPMMLSRPLPDNGRIDSVEVIRKRCGPNWKWAAQVTCTFEETNKPPKGKAIVALDLGWRKIDGNIRVAAFGAIDDAPISLPSESCPDLQQAVVKVGNGYELQLTPEVISGIRKSEELRSIRDSEFNDIRSILTRWLQENDVPEEIRTLKKRGKLNVMSQLQFIHWINSLRSQAQLASLIYRWKDNRFEGYEEILEALENWRYADQHLWEWESEQRRGAIARRNNLFKNFASWLRSIATMVVIEGDFKITDVAERKGLIEDTNRNEIAQSNRQLAGTSILRICIKNKLGNDCIGVPAKNTSKECHVCGEVVEFADPAALEQECHNHHQWDRDHNAWKVLLKRYASGDVIVKTLGTARKGKKKRNSKKLATGEQKIVG